MANPVREMNTVADGRKGDPQQDVEGKNILGRIHQPGKSNYFFPAPRRNIAKYRELIY